MNAFYSTDFTETKILLTDQEARHCTKVLRKNRGDEIHVLDGKGSIYESVISDIGKDNVELSIISKKHENKNECLPHIAFGLIKNASRIEWMLEKLTEIGVQRIIPLKCQRAERGHLKKERLNKILVSAMKQSMRRYLPILEDPVNIVEFIMNAKSESKYIASYGPEVQELSGQNIGSNPYIMIGPEGDFTDEEVALSINAGFKRVNLGKSRLRAETATIVACTILNFK